MHPNNEVILHKTSSNRVDVHFPSCGESCKLLKPCKTSSKIKWDWFQENSSNPDFFLRPPKDPPSPKCFMYIQPSE